MTNSNDLQVGQASLKILEAAKTLLDVVQNDPRGGEAIRRCRSRFAALLRTMLRLHAEREAGLDQYEAGWKKATGVAPPRWMGILELKRLAIPWWQEKAALAGIAAATIMEAGDKIVSVLFEPIIRGRLERLHREDKKNRARRRRSPAAGEVPDFTDKELEAVRVVADYGGNVAKAARGLGISRQALQQRLESAWGKFKADGIRMIKKDKLKISSGGIPKDRRGQPDIYEDEDGAARPGHRLRTGKGRDKA